MTELEAHKSLDRSQGPFILYGFYI